MNYMVVKVIVVIYRSNGDNSCKITLLMVLRAKINKYQGNNHVAKYSMFNSEFLSNKKKPKRKAFGEMYYNFHSNSRSHAY